MNSKYLLLVGGAGNLGKAVIRNFRDSWKTISLDMKQNTDSHFNILLKENSDIETSLPSIYHEISRISEKVDSIVCVAGGWTGGSIKSPEIFGQFEKMTAHLATKFLNSKGLLVLTGAAVPFKEPSPGMLAYALSKTATHALALNMAQLEDLPKDSTVATILPEVLDTPDNRKAMPDADFSKWASLDGVAGLLRMWSDGQNRPKNGSFAVLKAINEKLHTLMTQNPTEPLLQDPTQERLQLFPKPETQAQSPKNSNTDQNKYETLEVETPAAALGTGTLVADARSPLEAYCISCKKNIITVATFHTGRNTHVMGGLLCCLGFYCCCCCLPYHMKDCKDVRHRCPYCDELIKIEKFRIF